MKNLKVNLFKNIFSSRIHFPDSNEKLESQNYSKIYFCSRIHFSDSNEKLESQLIQKYISSIVSFFLIEMETWKLNNLKS